MRKNNFWSKFAKMTFCRKLQYLGNKISEKIFTSAQIEGFNMDYRLKNVKDS